MLSWKVYRENFNKKEIEEFDIFKNYGSTNYFEKKAKELKKKYPNKEEWEEKFRGELMYSFWCKAEHEIVLTSWPPFVDVEEINRLHYEVAKHEKEYGYLPYSNDVRLKRAKKIDIYDQLRMNWNIFIDYVWNNI